MTDPDLRWHKTDESDSLYHCPEHKSLLLIYGRIYTIGMGYAHSETNQLVLNLKKSPVNSSEAELRYKQRAIEKFASEVVGLFARIIGPYPNELAALVPMPPSKTTGHPAYDDRMDKVAKKVSQEFPNVRYWPLLKGTKSVGSAHSGAGSREPEDIFKVIEVDKAEVPNYQKDEVIYIFDDVLTSGAHFTAARRRILEHFPSEGIGGLFWAKAQDPQVLDPSEELSDVK